MTKPTFCVIAVAGLIFATSGSAGASDPIATDRPGNGNAATTVPRHRLQIETSASYSRHDAGAVTLQQITLPTLVRFGVLDGFELRLGSSVVGIDATSGSDDGAALTDTTVGAKFQAASHAGWTPNVAVMVDVALATGSGAFTSDAAIPDARVAASWSLPGNLGLLLNAGIDVPKAGGDRFVRVGYVVNVGYVPAGLLAGKLSVFAEAFGRLSLDSDQGHVVQFDFGAAYSVNNDWQVDVFSQHGVSDAATDLQLAIGLSARL